jgi:hypothetical protein
MKDMGPAGYGTVAPQFRQYRGFKKARALFETQMKSFTSGSSTAGKIRGKLKNQRISLQTRATVSKEWKGMPDWLGNKS